MILVEQGVIGLILFIAFLFSAFVMGERIYHQTKTPAYKRLVMITLLMLLVISSLQLINDLLETDKIGPFFFLSLAILVNVDLYNRKMNEDRRIGG